MNVREVVSNIPILQAANSASLASLMTCAAVKHFKKGEHVFLDMDNMQNIYFLATGNASLYKFNNKHEKKVIFIYGDGALLNEEILDGRPASASCELLSDSQVLCFKSQQFLYICEQDFALTKSIMDSMALKIRKLCRQMKNTGSTLRGDKRIAAKLWKLSKDHGKPCDLGIQIDFNMTITYLADMLGSKRETVSRQLKMLTERGLVVIIKNRFIIPNRDELKKYFDEM